MLETDAQAICTLVINISAFADFADNSFPHRNVDCNRLALVCGAAIRIIFAVRLPLPYVAIMSGIVVVFNNLDTGKKTIKQSLIEQCLSPSLLN
jgi:hypothetical protein